MHRVALSVEWQEADLGFVHAGCSAADMYGCSTGDLSSTSYAGTASAVAVST